MPRRTSRPHVRGACTNPNVAERSSLFRVRILDECDEMLNMGFADSVEKILAAAADSAEVQTMLFSATMPPWVRRLQDQYLRPSAAFVDLVGTEKQKAAATVQHKILYCHWQERGSIVKDLIKCYGFSGAAAARACTVCCPVEPRQTSPASGAVVGEVPGMHVIRRGDSGAAS